MQGSDNVITVEMFNAGVQEIKSEFNQRFDKLENKIGANTIKIDSVQSSINTEFTTVGIIIALVGLIIAVIGVFKKEKTEIKSEDLSPRNIRDIRALIREEFSMLQRNV